MKTLPLLCATALTAVSLSFGPALAAEEAMKKPADNTAAEQTEMKKPDAAEEKADTENMDAAKAETETLGTIVIQDVAAQKEFLKTLYDAQISLHNKDKKQAKTYIQAAMDQLGQMTGAIKTDMGTKDPANEVDAKQEKLDKSADTADQVNDEAKTAKNNEAVTSDDKSAAETEAAKVEIYEDSYKGRKVMEVEFGSTLMPERAVMPVDNGEITVVAIQKALDIKGLKLAELKDVDVRYISAEFDAGTVKEQLLQARAELEKEDFYGAQYDLLQIQREMLEDGDDDAIPAQTRARDNIALTRYLVKAQSFDAARETIDEAESALGDMDALPATENKQKAGLANFRKEVASLRKAIEEQDPTMLDKIDETLKSWWNELS